MQASAPRRCDPSAYPAQPHHRQCATPRVDAAARRPRPRARVAVPGSRLRVCRHRLRRPRAAVDSRRGRCARLRRRALLADEVVLDGRLAHGLLPRASRRRRRAREAEELPRLRHLPADPDRGDRRAARSLRLPGRGEPDLPRPPRRALLRLDRAGCSTSTTAARGRCSSGRRSPKQHRRRSARSSARCKLARDAHVAVSRRVSGSAARAATVTCASRSSRTRSASGKPPAPFGKSAAG